MLKNQKDLFWYMAYLLDSPKSKMTNNSSLLWGLDPFNHTLIILFQFNSVTNFHPTSEGRLVLIKIFKCTFSPFPLI